MKDSRTDGTNLSDADQREPRTTVIPTPLFPALANIQLQELRGMVQKPLSGRHVLIPVTSKAFVVGSLTPNKNDDGEEQVVLVAPNPRSNGGAGNANQVVLRQHMVEALEHEQPRRKEATKVQQKLKKSKKTISIQEPKQNDTKSDNADAIPNHPADDPMDIMAEPGLPFFDIKEEIDGTGNVIRSETVNVTHQLELIEAQYAETKDDTTDESTIDGSAFNNYTEVTSTMDDTTTASNSIPNDQEYEAITVRLDELTRLEEEAEAKSAVNRLSSLKLQSRGWSKGFLSNKKQAGKPVAKKETPTKAPESPKKKTASVTEESQSQGSTSEPSTQQSASRPAKQQASKASKANVDEKDKGWSKGFLNKSKQPAITTVKKAVGATHDPTAGKSITDETSKKVSFHTNVTEVREIPRIGNHSVSSLRKQPAPSSTVAAAKPFDASVVSSVVKERPIVGVTNLPIQGRPREKQEQGEPKKKLSRFAQERMQNR